MTTQDLERRAGAVTFKGNPMTLQGPVLEAGAPAPEFALAAGDLANVTLDTLVDGGTRAAMLIVVPSLDTSVCSLESHKFNQRLGELPAGVRAWVVSMDLPFAQSRWAGAQEGGKVGLGLLSDYRDRSFGRNYGLLIEELGLLARAIVVVGKDKSITYVQIVPEVANEPDYDAALKAAAAAAAG
jgi:thioredoxin-dependent peroxiredoxin